MKRNVTLKIEGDLLREARVLAAHQGTSLSAMLSEQLVELVRDRKGYEQARRRALARMENARELNWTPPASRDELHER